MNPTRSQNNTDTTFRSSRTGPADSSVSGAVQKGQNGNSPGAPRRKQGRTPPAESKTVRHLGRSYDAGMADAVAAERAYGGQTMVEPLRRVLLRRPPAHVSDWRRFGWRAEPDPVKLAEEHEQLCLQLEQAGAEIVVAPATTLDAIYAYDPALVADPGAVLLRPGKPDRADEVDAAAADLEAAGVPVVARLDAPAHAEGGDLARLDERTLLAGRSYRTSADGILALERILGIETIVFDLPHFHGPDKVLHLLSLLSPLDRDLVVGYTPLMPVRLVQLLDERGIEIVEVPDDEFATMGANALALAPRRALVLERNVETRRRLERAGVAVAVYRGDELSKGDGGPTCLTLPLLRGGLASGARPRSPPSAAS